MPFNVYNEENCYHFHRKIIRPADGWLFEFWPAAVVVGCGYDTMAMGRGGQGKSTAMRTSSANTGK